MTKSEYREYIAGEVWRKRRADYLSQIEGCNRCEAPRKLVVLVYDQDLHVHHRSYARIGNERPEDLEALCRRCHEIETFGRSELRVINPADICQHCKEAIWDFGLRRRDGLCDDCQYLLEGVAPRWITEHRLVPDERGVLVQDIGMWKFILRQMVWMVDKDDIRRAIDIAVRHYETDDDSAWSDLADLPEHPGYVKRDWDRYQQRQDGDSLEETEEATKRLTLVKPTNPE